MAADSGTGAFLAAAVVARKTISRKRAAVRISRIIHTTRAASKSATLGNCKEMSLDILYEDSALLFVNKPAGIVVQRGYDADEPVLLETAMQYTQPLFLMQRLDRGTSGVMFFSKLASINANLTRQFEQKRIRKRYVAICEGELGERQTIDAPLVRIGPISFGVRDGGKRAITIVTPLRATPRGSFAAVDLLTGRTHQIRFHLAAVGHPLPGDS